VEASDVFGGPAGCTSSISRPDQLFATNYFSTITPQGSSANLLFAGSGYLTQRELYRLGAIATGVNILIYFVVGTAWLFVVAR